MKHKRRPLALLTAIAATPAFAAPFLAIGENAELFLTATTSVRFEDNIDYSSSNEQSDEIFEFTPGLELTFGKSSLTRGSLSVYQRFIAYSDNTRYNDDLFNAVFNSVYDGSKLTLRTNASYRELNQTTRDVQAIIESEEIAVGADAELALTEKTKVGVGIQFNDLDYGPAGLADRKTYTVPVNYYFAIRPKIDLSAGVRYRHNDVNQNNFDSDEFYFNVGARGEFTSKLSGSFSVGYTIREADTPAGIDGDNSMLGFTAGLAYAYSPKTQITLDAVNDYDTGALGDGQEKTAVTLGVSSQITPAFGVRGSISYQQIEYINVFGGASREDDFVVFSAGVTYTVNSHINLAASYSHYNNDSNNATSDFKANVVSLSANFRY